MFDSLRKRIARLIAPTENARKANAGARQYQAARASRLTAGWASSTTSADSELVTSLVNLRNRSRALVRDAAYAKRAKVIVQNNVVGSGIGMQAQVMSTRDVLRESINDAIEEAFETWSCAESCHTGGTLHFADLERALMGQIFEAGEVLVRKHTRAFGDSAVPFALELIEAERLADELSPGPAYAGNMVRMGVELDPFYRPVAYFIRERHPGELRLGIPRSDRVERVPAEQIMHLRLVERWPQTRGEPWLHAVARKLNDMDGYSEAEIVAARAAASYVFTIETPEPDTPLANQVASSSSSAGDVAKEIVVEEGMAMRLAPGEEWKTHAPNRPNTALDPFMRYMLREVAAGTGVSYESLSRDYAQSNYSSSRLALLDDRDLWKMLQRWFVRNFRLPLHKEWLQAAVLAGAIPEVRVEEYALSRAKFEAVLFKPRGWSWIKPNEEVDAYKEAIKAGFMTVSDVISITGEGKDLEDVLRQRERELAMMAEKNLEFDTSPSVYIAAETGSQKGTGTPPPPEGEGADGTAAAGAPASGDAQQQPERTIRRVV